MNPRILGIVGSYRKGGTIDTAVDAVLAGARERGAEIDKIYLIDWHLEFCRTCCTCTQAPGEKRGRCVIQDELASLLELIDGADALVNVMPWLLVAGSFFSRSNVNATSAAVSGLPSWNVMPERSLITHSEVEPCGLISSASTNSVCALVSSCSSGWERL